MRHAVRLRRVISVLLIILIIATSGGDISGPGIGIYKGLDTETDAVETGTAGDGDELIVETPKVFEEELLGDSSEEAADEGSVEEDTAPDSEYDEAEDTTVSDTTYIIEDAGITNAEDNLGETSYEEITEEATSDEEGTTEAVSSDEATEETSVDETAEGASSDDAESSEIEQSVDAEVISTDNSLRLFVGTDNSEVLTVGSVLYSYDGASLVVFDDAAAAREGYEYYGSHAAFAVFDTIISSVADEGSEQTGDMTSLTSAVMTEEDNPLTNLEEAVAENTVSTSTKTIAVIDTGANSGVIDAVSMLGDSTADDNGHGQAMVDTILSENPLAKIVSIKAFDESGKATASTLYSAIQYAISIKADIINLSISGSNSAANQIVASAIRSAISGGAVVIGAAGNSGTDASGYIPASVDGVITIGACDDEGFILSTSNYGDCVDYYLTAKSTSYATARATGMYSKSGKVEGVEVKTKKADEVDDATKSDASEEVEPVEEVTTTINFANQSAFNITDITVGTFNDGEIVWGESICGGIGHNEMSGANIYYVNAKSKEVTFTSDNTYILKITAEGHEFIVYTFNPFIIDFSYTVALTYSFSDTDGYTDIFSLGGHLLSGEVFDNGVDELEAHNRYDSTYGTGVVRKITQEMAAEDEEYFKIADTPDTITATVTVAVYQSHARGSASMWISSINSINIDSSYSYYAYGAGCATHGAAAPGGKNDTGGTSYVSVTGTFHKTGSKTSDNYDIYSYTGYAAGWGYPYQAITVRLAVKQEIPKRYPVYLTIQKEAEYNFCDYSMEGIEYELLLQWLPESDAAKGWAVAGQTYSACKFKLNKEGRVSEIYDVAGSDWNVETGPDGTQYIHFTVTEGNTVVESDGARRILAYWYINEVSGNDYYHLNTDRCTGFYMYANDYRYISYSYIIPSLRDTPKTVPLTVKKYMSGDSDTVYSFEDITYGVWYAPISSDTSDWADFKLSTVADGTSADNFVGYFTLTDHYDDEGNIDYGIPKSFTPSGNSKITIDGVYSEQESDKLAEWDLVTDLVKYNSDEHTVEGLPFGIYCIQEIDTNANYQLSTGVAGYTVTANNLKNNANLVVEAKMSDKVNEPDIYIQGMKTTSNTNSKYNKKGVKFTVYTDSACTKTAQMVTTDKEGNETYSNVVLTTGANGYTSKVQLANYNMTDDIESIADAFPVTYYIKETYTPKYLSPNNTVQKITFYYKVDSEGKGVITYRYEGEDGTETDDYEGVFKFSYEDTYVTGIKLNKSVASGCDELVENNSLYSLSGAVYTFYENVTCTTKAKDIDGNDLTLTTYYDSTNKVYTTATKELNNKYYTAESGTFRLYYKETTAPKGYVLDTGIHYVDIEYSKNKTNYVYTVKATDTPVAMPISILLTKYGTDGAKVSGAEFTVKYFNTSLTQLQGAESTRQWVFRTDDDGQIALDKSHLVEGDAFYYRNGEAVLPLGTVTIEETGRSSGYVMEGSSISVGDSKTYTEAAAVLWIRETGIYDSRTGGNVISHIEAKKYSLSVTAKNYSNPILTSYATDINTSTKEVFLKGDTAVTDRVAIRNLVPQSYYTLVTTLVSKVSGEALGTGTTTFKTDGSSTVISQNISFDASEWDDSCYEKYGDLMFYNTLYYTGESGGGSTAADALRYTDNPTFITILANVTVDGQKGSDFYHAMADMKGQATDSYEADETLKPVYIGSDYEELQNQIKDVMSGTGIRVLRDNIYVYNLTPDKTYTITARQRIRTLGDTDDGNYKDSSGWANAYSNEVEADADGRIVVSLDYNTDTDDFVNYENGIALVSFVQVADENGRVVAQEYDITNDRQTVRSPKIKTTAWNPATGTHLVYGGEEQTIVDTVDYYNVWEGETYTLKGTLYDEGGNVIAVSEPTDFVAAGVTGTVDVYFKDVDISDYIGQGLYVFESMYHGEYEIATHNEPESPEQTVYVPTFSTELLSDETGTHTVPANTVTNLTDTVNYKLFTSGTYTVKGVLYERVVEYNEDGTEKSVTLGKQLADTSGEFTVEVEEEEGKEGLTAVDGTTSVVYENFDTSLIVGGSAVAYTYIYDDKGNLVAAMEDINDESEIIRVPYIETSLTDNSGSSYFINTTTEAEIKLTDTVDYHDLTPGEDYVMSGVLYDKETGESIHDADGNEVVGSTAFTAESVNGTVTVPFSFTITKEMWETGFTIVAFEEVKSGSDSGEDTKPVAIHYDITDEAQTLYAPAVHTFASRVESGNVAAVSEDAENYDEADAKLCYADGKVTITDFVKLTNLMPNTEYRVVGVLMDSDTGEKLLIDDMEVTAETTYISAAVETLIDEAGNEYDDNKGVDGEASLTFTFDATGLDGRTLTVYEYLYYDDDADESKDVPISQHTEIDDGSQKIYFANIGTTLTAAATEAHEAETDECVTLCDRVEYHNFIIGKEYTVQGTLHIRSVSEDGMVTDGGVLKDAQGADVVAEAVTFVAEQTDGYVMVEFKFDASMLGDSSVVAFEKMMYKGRIVATHEDIADENQTVTFITETPPEEIEEPTEGITEQSTTEATEQPTTEVTEQLTTEVTEQLTAEGVTETEVVHTVIKPKTGDYAVSILMIVLAAALAGLVGCIRIKRKRRE